MTQELRAAAFVGQAITLAIIGGIERTMATRNLDKVTVRATGGQIGNQALYAIRIFPLGDEDFLVTDLLRDRAEAEDRGAAGRGDGGRACGGTRGFG